MAIEFPGGDLEAQFLGIQLRQVFIDAGWKVDLRAALAAPLLFGLVIPDPGGGAGKLLWDALADAGLNPETANVPVPGAMMQSDEGRALQPQCRLIVGAKLTEFLMKEFPAMRK
jgi:hypothetical protein